jgi:hypothetical protein
VSLAWNIGVKLSAIAASVARFADPGASGLLPVRIEREIATKLWPGVIDRTCWAHFEKRL